jgi:hypothetical protein
MHYILFYDLVDNALEARAPYREEHLARALRAHESGLLVMAGALTDPPDTSILVFEADDRSAVEEFARNDPYVNNGVVTKWTVREWAVAIPRG